MTSLNRKHTKKIYFFDQSCQKNKFQNGLKEYIYFLKSKGFHQNIDFSFSHAEDSLHGHLSIKDNFILDSVPTSLIKNSEINLNEFLGNVLNTHIKKLILKLGDLNRPINELDKNQIKLASIIKTILSQSQYLFLDDPETNLTQEDLEQVKKCLEFEVEHNNRVVMFKSQNKMLWPQIVTNIISKNENLEYIDTPNPMHENKWEEKTPYTYNFTLNKKVS